MTNGDKYLKDGVDVGEFICGLRDYLDSHRDNYDTSNLINNYLNKTVKPTLTEDEKVILRNVDKTKADRICRGEFNGEIYVEKGSTQEETDMYAFSHLFQFIKPRRRI